jgi:hypothetical protein
MPSYIAESNFRASLVQNANVSDTMQVSSGNFFVMFNFQGHDATVYTSPNICSKPMVQMFTEWDLKKLHFSVMNIGWKISENKSARQICFLTWHYL